MRSILIVIINYCVIVLGVHQPDINRLIPVHRASQSLYQKTETDLIEDSDDYAHHSSRLVQREPSLPVPVLHAHSKTTTDAKAYQPREDPKLFYQSPAYLERKNDKTNVNWDIAQVYPGRDVVYAHERPQPRLRVVRERVGLLRSPLSQGRSTKLCVRCPQDKTLIAKPGSSRVYMNNPQLMLCSGHLAPRHIRFTHMYGPKFGSLIAEGTHIVVGKILQGHEVLQHCKMQVNVVTQGCYTTQHLVSKCEGDRCTFICRDPKLELLGPAELTCRPDMTWEGELPVCRARTWCEPLTPPEHGRVSCHGSTRPGSSGMVEGARCRVQCLRGFRQSRGVAVCRRGQWTQGLMCFANRNRDVRFT